MVGVVVVNWNETAMSLRALCSACANDDVLPVLVDNGSDDDPTPDVRETLPHAVVVRLSENAGYAAGGNAGVRAAMARGAQHVLLLNNDAVLEPEAIETLAQVAETVPRSILAPLIVYADRPEVVWSAGGRVRRPSMESAHIGSGEARGAYRSISLVPWATGCALWFSTDTYLAVGGFDERFFLYLEDVDWCLRAARLEIPTLLVADAVVRHAVSSTVHTLPRGEVRYYAYRNHYRFAFRNSSWWGRGLTAADLAWTLFKIAVRSALFPGYRHDREYHARTIGLAHLLRGRWGRAPALDEAGVLTTSLFA